MKPSAFCYTDHNKPVTHSYYDDHMNAHVRTEDCARREERARTRAKKRDERMGIMSKQTRTKTGWVILHPSGRVETDYFQHSSWSDKGKMVSRDAWRRKYRPNCIMVRATLSWEE